MPSIKLPPAQVTSAPFRCAVLTPVPRPHGLGMPYLDTLRWVFIAVALIGIVVAIHARIDDWKRGLR